MPERVLGRDLALAERRVRELPDGRPRRRRRRCGSTLVRMRRSAMTPRAGRTPRPRPRGRCRRTRGPRPVATRTRSASTLAPLPSPPSKVQRGRLAGVLDPRWPASPGAAAMLALLERALELLAIASSSSIGIRWSSISTIVTSVPEVARRSMRTRRRSRRRPGSRAASAPPRRRAGRSSRRSAARRCRRRAGAATASRWRSPRAGSATSSPPSTAIVFGAGEAAAAGDDRDAVRLDDARDAVDQPVDDRSACWPGPGAKSSSAPATLTPSCAKCLVRLLERVRGLHPRLRRDAADGDARPADPVLPRSAPRGRRAGRRGSRPGSRPARRPSTATSHSIDRPS